MPRISDFPNAGALDGTELIPINQFGIDTVTTIDDLGDLLMDQINDEIGLFKKVVTTPQSNATTTPASITALEQVLEPGTYKIEGILVWQAAATGTGVQFYIDCTGGAVSKVVMAWFYTTTATSAATGIVDGTTAVGGQLVEGKAQRGNAVACGLTAGVDTANADVIGVMDAIVTVTTATTFRLMFNSSAASAVAVQDGTHLLIRKVL